jgi:hypothetical protein
VWPGLPDVPYRGRVRPSSVGGRPGSAARYGTGPMAARVRRWMVLSMLWKVAALLLLVLGLQRLGVI